MTRIIFIRHGQSQANLESRFAGHIDVPLTELGRTQARLAADYIVKREKIAHRSRSEGEKGLR